MNLVHRLGPARPQPAFPEGRIDPLGQLGYPIDDTRHGPLHDPRGEPRSQRVDRLDRPQPVELVGAQYQVRVGNLGCAVVEFDPAADHSLGADRQEAREVISLDVEVGQGQPPGRIGAYHPIRPRAATRLVRFDPNSDGHDLVGA